MNAKRNQLRNLGDANTPIDDGLYAPINGLEQWVTIRGTSTANPPLLILSGPGVSLSAMAPFFAPWEKDFTLVQWDQPAAGATFSRNGRDAGGPLSIERLAADAAAVAAFVCRRIGVSKIAAVGVSAGSIVGLTLAAQHPDLLSAYIGTGQVVDWRAQDQLSYALLLEQALRSGDARASAELQAIGRPPYKDSSTDAVKSKYASALTKAEAAEFATLDPATAAALRTPPPGAKYIANDIAGADPHALALAAYDSMRSEITTFDARKLALKYKVPMFFLQGELDAFTVSTEVAAYEGEIVAPQKAFATVAGGGHSAIFLRGEFLTLLNKHVRPVIESCAC